jgi:hypothetical protein
MGAVYQQRFKKSAQGGTTVTLVPDTQEALAEGHPTHLAATQIVLTFTATPAEMWGTAIADGRRYVVTVEEYT